MSQCSTVLACSFINLEYFIYQKSLVTQQNEITKFSNANELSLFLPKPPTYKSKKSDFVQNKSGKAIEKVPLLCPVYTMQLFYQVVFVFLPEAFDALELVCEKKHD